MRTLVLLTFLAVIGYSGTLKCYYSDHPLSHLTHAKLGVADCKHKDALCLYLKKGNSKWQRCSDQEECDNVSGDFQVCCPKDLCNSNIFDG